MGFGRAERELQVSHQPGIPQSQTPVGGEEGAETDLSDSPFWMYVQGPSGNIRRSLAWMGLGRPRRIWKSLCL